MSRVRFSLPALSLPALLLDSVAEGQQVVGDDVGALQVHVVGAVQPDGPAVREASQRLVDAGSLPRCPLPFTAVDGQQQREIFPKLYLIQKNF